ncbi:hypothetical protein PS874_06269 [Pseudomonas fluorescens]|nr:hypothetical protein PS874_06269 [Pseudomonas fluorescens]
MTKVTGKSTYGLLSQYPEQVFNSKAWGAGQFREVIKEMLTKESILIVFASENNQVDYDIVQIGHSQNNIVNSINHSTLSLCNGIYNFKNKHGSKISLSDKVNNFTVLAKYLDGAEYDVIFYTDDDMLPLLVNEAGETVAYVKSVDKGFVFVLPQIKRKKEFLLEFFNDSLSDLFPDLFPFNGLFGWLNDGSYPLPGEEDLRQNRKLIENKYKDDVAENESALVKLKDDHKFLRDILSETGEQLVVALAQYFEWLGFGSVRSMDEHSVDVLEEDLQIDLDQGILVVEIKGIGGTSKDSECAQISKIKNRRMAQRQAFDVKALYVVNHQRFVSPRARTNPPFTPHQIKDAQYDERGLISTYELYKAYFYIIGGLLKKEAVREKLLEFGLVEFSPDLIELGVADELYMRGSVVILNLSGQRISVGMTLVAKKGGEYFTHKIISVRVNNVDVDAADQGEIGVGVNGTIKKGSEIFILGPQ